MEGWEVNLEQGFVKSIAIVAIRVILRSFRVVEFSEGLARIMVQPRRSHRWWSLVEGKGRGLAALPGDGELFIVAWSGTGEVYGCRILVDNGRLVDEGGIGACWGGACWGARHHQ